MTYTMLAATEADALELAPLMRAGDRDEVMALGLEPAESLLESLRGSREAWTARADGRVICMTGVCPTSAIGRTGVPWLLGSDLVPLHGPHFLRESLRLVARWQAEFPVLRNVVDGRYRQALRWLDWLGFLIRDPQPIGTGVFWIAEREA